jgi:DNA-binding NtrC family response regulator
MTDQGSGKRVLVVDETRPILDLLQLLLTSTGFTVLVAATSSEALAQCREHAPAVALVDRDLPTAKHSRALLAEMRALLPELRCCLMTTGVHEYTAADMLALGVARVLQKPFSFDALVEIVKQLSAPPA